MTRLIDADEIMKALSIFNDTTNGNSHFLNGIETAKELIDDAPTADPIEWFKAWIGEIMMNNNDEPLTQSEILRRIDEGGLKRFIEDYERERR